LSRRDGLASQVDVGIDEGLKHDSSIHCDALVSVPKASLTDYVGRLSRQKLEEVAYALRVALAIE
jgi:mRNA interferase MazF